MIWKNPMESSKRRGRRWQHAACGMLLALGMAPAHAVRLPAPPAPVAVAAAEALADKHVLFLADEGFGRPGKDILVRSFLDTLVASGVPAENIMVEFLDLPRFRQPGQRRALQALLQQR